MIALYIIAGITALFTLLLSLNVSVRVIFDSSAPTEDMRVYAKIGFYKINIIPEKQKKEKKPKKQKKEKKAGRKKTKSKKLEKTKEEQTEKPKKKYTIPEIFGVVKDIGTVLLKRFRKYFKVKIYSLNIVLGSDEAEKIAMIYGAAVQSAYYLYEFLDCNFNISSKPDNIKIIPDFSKTNTVFDIDIKFYIRLSRMLGLSVVSAVKFLKFWRKTGKSQV